MSEDRAAMWDQNSAADGLFGPEGGAVVWVRREEVLARGAARKAGDAVQSAMDLAALRVGIDAMARSLAQHHEISIDQFRRMIDSAEVIVRPMTEHVARIMPA